MRYKRGRDGAADGGAAEEGKGEPRPPDERGKQPPPLKGALRDVEGALEGASGRDGRQMGGGRGCHRSVGGADAATAAATAAAATPPPTATPTAAVLRVTAAGAAAAAAPRAENRL